MFSNITNFKPAHNSYNTNVVNLTCTCEDWKQKRYVYPIDDPRRLCKHIVKKLDINHLPTSIKHYRESISYYQDNEKGFNKFDFKTIIYLPRNDLKILGDHEYIYDNWMNIFDKEGHEYGFLLSQWNNEFIWAKQKKPIGYEEVEEYFSQPSMKLPMRLQEYEKKELIQYIKIVIPEKEKSHFRIEEDQYIPTPSHIYYSAGEDNDNIRNIIDHEIRWIIVKKNEIIIEKYDGKEYLIPRDSEKLKLIEKNTKIEEEQKRLQREADEINRKLEYEEELSEKREKAINKGYLFIVKDSLYREAITISNRNHDSQYTEYLDATEKISLEYMSTKQLLIASKIDLTLLQFNNVLKDIEVIKKVKGLNLDGWIVVNDGLKFGINLEKSSQYFSATIPDWYQIKTIHPITLQLIDLEDRQNVRMTNIMWKNDMFSELLQLVIQNIENHSNTNKIAVKSNKLIEREEWLQFVECPHCSSKNLHKKNKRVYGYGEVQRYQCMDCKKIFQQSVK